MATSTNNDRYGCVESTASLWEKTYERIPQTQPDVPFATDQNQDSLEQYPSIDDYEPYDTDSDSSPSIQTGLPSPPPNDEQKPWEYATSQDYLTIIINDDPHSGKLRLSLKDDLSIQGLKWTAEEEQLRPWHFGLTAIRLKFTKPRIIDIQLLSLSPRIPFWLKLKSGKQEQSLKNNTAKKTVFHRLGCDLDVGLHYGAFLDLNEFRYSPEHSWTNNTNAIWSLALDDQRSSGGYIEWIQESIQTQKGWKKQLLVTNIDQSIIVDKSNQGFNIYICQKCNMNEFEVLMRTKDNNNRGNMHRSGSTQNNLQQARSSSQHFRQRLHRCPTSNFRPPSLSRSKSNEPKRTSQFFPKQYSRAGKRAGCYFSTIQFSVHTNLHSDNDQTQDIQKQIRQILSALIDFFLAHNITICYAKINSDPGPQPYLFFQENIPDFSSLIMKYSWQMLSINGYRLQLHIDQQFIKRLVKLQLKEQNAEELFYRVCVYLSRIFSLKHFLNINQELQHAITESKRKRDHSTYDLVRKLDFEGSIAVYVPSVTITPTTIRIKPLTLCRTNRVLRAIEQFGKAAEHFILVDIRDENGRDLQSYHFRDLRSLLLRYLTAGFTLMSDDRQYKYLHHSQSQLRKRQFWFYHHDQNRPNLSFSQAYEWMGDFDDELNPAKHAARIALCFSTTKASVQVPVENVCSIPDITTNDGRLTFTDGCGTMSTTLRNKIKESLGIRADFSAVQFRYDGAKGVVSLYPDMPQDIDLCIRPSMKKFQSDHDYFEVCKLSAPRPLFLNRQAILLLSYRQVPDSSFLILQQQYHLALVRGLLRNSDAEKLILQKIPSWFLPPDIHLANIDYIHEPFFRQLLISACLQSTRELLNRTRIRIPVNEGRNMIGIVDEYEVLEPDEVYIQYTVLKENLVQGHAGISQILDKCKVVITKNPCHHPGDIRTFTAVNHPRLAHLKDVVVFSQKDARPAPHDISGSDLDGDEYLVVWHKDLVPHNTPNAQPYDYDASTPQGTFHHKVEREDINETILNVAEQDCLGRLSNLHLAFADKYGVEDNENRPEDLLSTVGLAGAISQEVDSGKTGYHPLTGDKIKRMNSFLGNKRPDYMANPNFEQYESKHVLGELYRASKRTIFGWNQLVRSHRFLHHLQVRTRDELEEKDEEEAENGITHSDINVDQSLLAGVDREHPGYDVCAAFADQLVFVYRQEMLEILSLYGLSHESDLWCSNLKAGMSGELEGTARTELKQLVTRTRDRFYREQVIYCEPSACNENTPMIDLCVTCRKRQQAITVASYYRCYDGKDMLEEASVISLPWLFATSLLQNRVHHEELRTTQAPLSVAVSKALSYLVDDKRRLILRDTQLKFRMSEEPLDTEVTVDLSVCAFVELLQQYLEPKKYSHWSLVLNRFIRTIKSDPPLSNQAHLSEEWKLILQTHEVEKKDIYADMLLSIVWTEREDKLMHQYFEEILNICFDEGRRTNEREFLDISEDIILLLQKMAINETIF